MDKYEKDGKVAIIYHPFEGSGWYTAQKNTYMVFDPEIAKEIEQMNWTVVEYLAIKKYEMDIIGSSLRIYWIKKGEEFRIESYNGSERIILKEEDDFITA